MELMVAVALSAAVIAGVSALTSLVVKRSQDARVDQAALDAQVRIKNRLAREFAEVAAWHVLRPERVVYTSSFVSLGEENEPYSTSLVCEPSKSDKQFVLLYQRMPPMQMGAATVPPGRSGATRRPLMEVPIASQLSKCAIEFGVLMATESSERKTVHWVNHVTPNDLIHVTHLRITMADANGALFPIHVVKRKR